MRKTFLGRQIGYVEQLRESLGLTCAIRFRAHKIASRLQLRFGHSIRLRPTGIRHSFMARAGTSDLAVFSQIFIQRHFLPLRDIPEPKLILDLGANVAYATICFLNWFPSTRVIAVEPDPANLRVCEQNLSPYADRVRILQGAVWGTRKHLVLQTTAWEDATQVREALSGEDASIPGMDLPSILELAGGLQVDLLKIDIEGSEVEVFRCDPDRWLPRIRNIAIELHGPECELVFFQALRNYSYDLSFSGELTICRNLRPRTGHRV